MNDSPGLPELPFPESLWDVVDAALVINLWTIAWIAGKKFMNI
jgi:hypothetical protein